MGSSSSCGRTNSRLRVLNLSRQTVLADCVDVADRGDTRRKGLLGRSSLSTGEGLWIVPCESVHTFGMKFPIDLVYLDRKKKVKKVRSGVPPWRLSACLSAHSVLELASGTIHTTQTNPGDLLEFSPVLPQSECPINPGPSARAGLDPGDREGMTTPLLSKNLRAIAEFVVLVICTAAFALTVVGICGSVLGSDAGTRDFVEYWAAGHQLAHNANPYDSDAILGLERSAGFPSGIPVLIMWNPPPALLLVLPLGFLGPTKAELVWLLLLLVCFVASVRMVWIMHGRPKNQVHWLGYSFVPALACLLTGQVSIFVLLGLVLFLRLHRSRPFLAGVSLWLCLLKPHLFLPFGIVLLLWAIITRRYHLLTGTAMALGVSAAIASILDPLVWVQYGGMMSSMSTARMQQQIIPCLSIILRWIISPKTMWIQYLPSAFGIVWALGYYRKHYSHWDWMEHGSLLVLVSVLLAPYSWLVDQAILLPALLHAAYLTRSRSSIAILALGNCVVQVGIFTGLPLLHSTFYLWTAPAWLAWYIYATKRRYPTDAYEAPFLSSGAMTGAVKDYQAVVNLAANRDLQRGV
jgi:uncharacterized membrane protein (UPF0127 family)